MSYYVYPRERIIEAIKKGGGRARLDQIYAHIAQAKKKKELERRERAAVRVAIWRLRKAGLIAQESPRTYILVKTEE